MKRLGTPLAALTLGAALLAMPACNTTEGFGKDLQRAGSELSETSREVGYQADEPRAETHQDGVYRADMQ